MSDRAAKREAEKKARLAAALRQNLKRRKTTRGTDVENTSRSSETAAAEPEQPAHPADEESSTVKK